MYKSGNLFIFMALLLKGAKAPFRLITNKDQNLYKFQHNY